VDLGEALPHLRDRHRQEVARLAVRRRDRERAGVLLGELVADPLQVADLAHDHLDRLQHLASGLGDAAQALAVAGEDVDAELAFDLEDRLGDAGLRREERLGGLGQVEVAPDRLLDEPELVEVHCAADYGRAGRSPTPASTSAARAIASLTAACSPIAACSRIATSGCALRSASTSGGRSWRRWPPVPRKSGTTSTVVAPSATTLSIASASVGAVSSRYASTTGSCGAAARIRSATASNGSAQRGSRAPCANRTSACAIGPTLSGSAPAN